MDLRTEQITSFDGTRIAVQSTGEGPPFVLANGLGGSIRAWEPMIRHLREHFRFISWDYRGLYDSGPPANPESVRVADQREDMRCVMDHFGVDTAVLAGWSMGVQVILDFALTYPDRVRALIPINGTAGDPFKTALHTEQSRWFIPLATELIEEGAGPFHVFTRCLASLPFVPNLLKQVGLVAPEADLAVFHALATEFAHLDWAVYMRTMREMGFHSTWDRLGEITVPTLVVGGTKDVMTPVYVAEAIAEATPGSDLLIIEGGTHYTPIEFPESINARIDEFFAERLPDLQAEAEATEVGCD